MIKEFLSQKLVTLKNSVHNNSQMYLLEIWSSKSQGFIQRNLFNVVQQSLAFSRLELCVFDVYGERGQPLISTTKH